MDERCIDEEGDPCKHMDGCKGKMYGWENCLMTKTEPVADVLCNDGLSCPSLIRSGLLKKDWTECTDGSWYHLYYKEDDGKPKYYTWAEAVYNQFLMAT